MQALPRRTFLSSSAALAFTSCLALPQAWSAAVPASTTLGPAPRFGVNYVPRKGWWYCWLDWDRQSVIDDLQAIAALGLDHIRVQCLWPLFQPGVNYVSDAMLARLVELLDLADKANLDVEVTVLNGWMSGLAFMPAWLLPPRQQRNIFTDPTAIAAEKLLFQKIAKVIAHHPRFLGFDLGNEVGVLLPMNPTDTVALDLWADDLFQLCESLAPGKFHVNGVDHEHWFSDFGFSRPALARQGKASIVHCYAYFTGALNLYGHSGVGTLHLAEYLVELAYAYQTNLLRPVWIEEIGVAPEWVPAEYLSTFVDQTVRHAIGTGKTWGITWWCSHDIDRSIGGFAEVEYSLGLLDTANRPKPIGKQIAALAAELRTSRPPLNNRTVALVIPSTGLAPTPKPADWAFAKAFMSLISQGKKPCIILESRAHDQPYLEARGITELIRLADVTT